MSNDDKTLNQQNASVISIYNVINILMFMVLKIRIPLNDATGTIVESRSLETLRRKSFSDKSRYGLYYRIAPNRWEQ
ncbi:hypothetical protein AB0758_00470 [Tolypothrix bouteillei VB521301_2]|uniref:Uncharacterized protein n=1 Tax=Tolypothrix bouteillei VB521301 TaxID=1479485 RepID=A0A0C1REC3_9CYAN